MDCPEENQIVDFLRAGLEDEAGQALEQHIDQCPHCAALVADMVQLYSLGPRCTDTQEPSETRASTVSRATPDIREGTSVGRYRVLAPVGSGGMGVVYRAHDPELDRDVALKVLRAPLLAGLDEDVRDLSVRLQREAQAMAKLSHPNVLSVYDVGTFHGRVFIAMEFIDGSTLAAWLRQRSRSVTEVTAVFLAAGRGLAAAHSAGLVHRDFKPDNVLIGRDGRVLVTDFGLARSVDDRRGTIRHEPLLPASVELPVAAAVTQTGALVGTPAYMAPEHFRGGASTALSDQFSFCTALYEAVYGQRPFAGTSLVSLSANVLAGRVRPPPKGVRVTPRIQRILARGLAVHPSDRFASMEALLRVLDRRPRPWGRVLLVGVPALALAGRAVLPAQGSAPASAYCDNSDTKLAAVWGPRPQQEVRDALLSTGVPYAHDSWHSLSRQIDDYAAQWEQQHAQVCQDELLAAKPAAALALQLACLERSRTAIRALDDLIIDNPTSAIPTAATVTQGLPPLGACEDVENLLVRDAAHQVRDATIVARLENILARAHLMVQARKLDAARAAATELQTEAKNLGDDWFVGRATHELAMTDVLSGQAADAEARFHDALSAALGGGDLETVASCALGLVWTSAMSNASTTQARRWYEHGVAALRRAPSTNLWLASELERAIGTVYLRGHEVDLAQSHFREALRIRKSDANHAENDLADIYGLLGSALVARGSFDEGVSLYRASVALIEQTYGPSHVVTGERLVNLGVHLDTAGRFREATTVLARAYAILRENLGDDNSTVILASQNLARNLSKIGDLTEAHALAQDALQRIERLHPEEVDTRAWSLELLGLVEKREPDFLQAAVDHLRESVRLSRTDANIPALTLAARIHNYGEGLLADAQPERALIAFNESIALKKVALAKGQQSGPKELSLATSTLGQARALIALHRPVEALPFAEQCQAHLTGLGDEITPMLALESRFVLAQLRWLLHPNQREQAVAAALNVAGELASITDLADARRLEQEVHRWVQSR